MNNRKATFQRTTAETAISIAVDLDGKGKSNITTGSGILDHLISQLSRHGLIDITLEATGDLEAGWHHLVEDTAICLGRVFRMALDEGRGIHRMGHAIVPLDESIALVAVDLNGRGYATVDTSLSDHMVESLPGDLVRHFLEAFAVEARITLHARIVDGLNPHHKAESLFKALAKALRQALEPDLRAPEDIPSTKGTIDK